MLVWLLMPVELRSDEHDYDQPYAAQSSNAVHICFFMGYVSA